jgi:CHASE2 domain-containing sensor protein
MNNPPAHEEFAPDRRLRLACMLLLVGLVVQVATFFWNAPLAFVLFIVVGSLLVAAGVLLYLWTFISRVPVRPREG